MGDPFEKFVIQNREAFNDSEPSHELWGRIQQEIQPKKRNRSIVWKLAAMLFLAANIYLIQDKYSGSKVVHLSSEFKEAENYYLTLINQKKQEIARSLDPDEEELFLHEIDELDSMYFNLKNNYQYKTSNERVLDAMINNLQLRLEILNRQIEILENIKSKSDEIDLIQI